MADERLISLAVSARQLRVIQDDVVAAARALGIDLATRTPRRITKDEMERIRVSLVARNLSKAADLLEESVEVLLATAEEVGIDLNLRKSHAWQFTADELEQIREELDPWLPPDLGGEA